MVIKYLNFLGEWNICSELEGQGDPTISQITADLTYLRDNYGTRPNYLRIGGRFVVFVYNVGDNCEVVDRWKQANDVVLSGHAMTTSDSRRRTRTAWPTLSKAFESSWSVRAAKTTTIQTARLVTNCWWGLF